jgi:hypothetical protein
VRRRAQRILAAVAVLAVAAVIVAVLAGQGGGGGDGTSAGATGPRSSSPSPSRSGPAPAREVEPGPDWAPSHGDVPVFRYHVVGDPRPGQEAPELFVSPADFGAQLDWLEEHGYEAVGLETVEAAWFGGGTLPPHPVVLSFDGVAGELMGTVYPELRRRGWPGVLVLGGDAGAPDPGAVRKLLAAGWELEPEAPRPDAGGRRRLEAEFGVPVRNFAFPQGDSGEGEEGALEAAGYGGATVTGAGFAERDAPFSIPRITVFGLSRVDGFAEAIRSRGEGVGA